MRKRKPSGQGPPYRPISFTGFIPPLIRSTKPAHAAHLTVVQRTMLGVLLRYKELEQELLIQQVLDIGSKRRGRWRSKFTEDAMPLVLHELKAGCLVRSQRTEVETHVGDPSGRPIFTPHDPSHPADGSRVDYMKAAWVWRLTVEGWAVAKSMKLDRLYRR